MEPKKSARLAEKRKLREEAGTPGPYEDGDLYYYAPLTKAPKNLRPIVNPTKSNGSKCNSKSNKHRKLYRAKDKPLYSISRGGISSIPIKNPQAHAQHHQIQPKIHRPVAVTPKTSNKVKIDNQKQTICVKNFMSTTSTANTSTIAPITGIPNNTKPIYLKKILNNNSPTPLSIFQKRKRWLKSYECISELNNKTQLQQIDEELQQFKLEFSKAETPISGALKMKNQKVQVQPNPNSIIYINRADSIRLSFPDGYEIPILTKSNNDFDDKKTTIPVQISIPTCSVCSKNLEMKKYTCSKTKKLICSLPCYKKNLEM